MPASFLLSISQNATFESQPVQTVPRFVLYSVILLIVTSLIIAVIMIDRIFTIGKVTRALFT